jgi:hypothetical protein
MLLKKSTKHKVPGLICSFAALRLGDSEFKFSIRWQMRNGK